MSLTPRFNRRWLLAGVSAAALFAANDAQAQVVTAVSLSATSLLARSPIGTVVGTITVTVSSGAFTGNISLSGSASASFAVNGSNQLVTTALLTSPVNPITLTATLGCAVFPQPFTIQATGESVDGAEVPANTTSINASPTVGSAGSGNLVTLTAGQNIQVTNGATTNTFGTAVTKLYTIGHETFQFGSNAWYAPVTLTGGGTNVPDPHPTVSLSATSVANNVPSGTTVGTLSTAVGAGTFTFTYAFVSGGANFSITGATLKTAAPNLTSNYPMVIAASNPLIAGSPFLLNVTITTGGTITFPITGGVASRSQEFGDRVVENFVATKALQPNNVPTGDTIYNFYNNKSWDIWAGFGDTTAGYFTLSITPWPSDTNYTAIYYDANTTGFSIDQQFSDAAKAAYQKIAQKCATIGRRLICVNIGWEWNKGGANDRGWEQAGNQGIYIEWFQLVASYFRTYAPNVLIGWVANGTSMNTAGTTLNSWYPGDDWVDVVGCDIYGGFAGGGTGAATVDVTSLSNYFGWCTQMSAATFIDSAHPAFATGTMTLPRSGTTVTIRKGGRKYVACPEVQNTARFPNWITDAFAWITGPVKGRILVFNYWDSYVVSDGSYLNLNDTASPDNQWIAGTKLGLYTDAYPIPRLS